VQPVVAPQMGSRWVNFAAPRPCQGEFGGRWVRASASRAVGLVEGKHPTRGKRLPALIESAADALD